MLLHRKYDLFNEFGELKSRSSKIWKDIATDLEGKITPTSLHLDVSKNRYQWKTTLKELLGFKENLVILSSTDDEVSTESELSSSVSSTPSNFERKLFKFYLSYDKFRLIYPRTVTYNNKHKRINYEVLAPHIWTDIINDAFLEVHKLPCNFIYKRGKAYTNSSSKYYITFNAMCKDESCRAKLFGWCDSKPNEGESLEISIITKNTMGLEIKHTTKRPLKGEKRKLIGNELQKDLACNWRRSNVSSLEFGRISPPNLYQNNVLRKAKQETKDKKLGIIHKCPVQSLVEFKNNSRYSGSIHTISIDPFFIHYWTNHQVTIYKDLNKNYSKISIHATGSVIKKLSRSSINLLSSHIFLYEAVISSTVGNIPVTQMISEKQDTLTIYYWLGQWMKSSIRSPNEVVCNYSKALLGAASRAFCNGSYLQTYVNNCFNTLIKNDKLPATYIRIDVAHVVKIFCRIKPFTGMKNKALKEIYVRTLRLLLTSETLDSFSCILESILTVSLCNTDGWYDEKNEIESPSEKSRIFILDKIKGLPTENILINENEIVDDSDECILNEDTESENEVSVIGQYLEQIKKKSLNSSKIKGK